jgi:hypothetical protein
VVVYLKRLTLLSRGHVREIEQPSHTQPARWCTPHGSRPNGALNASPTIAPIVPSFDPLSNNACVMTGASATSVITGLLNGLRSEPGDISNQFESPSAA